jgi:hypothetical protein
MSHESEQETLQLYICGKGFEEISGDGIRDYGEGVARGEITLWLINKRIYKSKGNEKPLNLLISQPLHNLTTRRGHTEASQAI